MRPPDCSKLAVNCKNRSDVTILRHGASSNVFDVVLFLLSSSVTGPSFMSISSLVVELWQFPFIRNWSEIRKSEIPPSDFYPISGDRGKLGKPSLARTSTECFKIPGFKAFTVSELLRENQQGYKTTPRPPRLGLNISVKFQNTKRASSHTALMGNCPTCRLMS